MKLKVCFIHLNRANREVLISNTINCNIFFGHYAMIVVVKITYIFNINTWRMFSANFQIYKISLWKKIIICAGNLFKKKSLDHIY